jgi:hypothetical protein
MMRRGCNGAEFLKQPTSTAARANHVISSGGRGEVTANIAGAGKTRQQWTASSRGHGVAGVGNGGERFYVGSKRRKLAHESYRRAARALQLPSTWRRSKGKLDAPRAKVSGPAGRGRESGRRKTRVGRAGADSGEGWGDRRYERGSMSGSWLW